jgi:tetratricopeptide (TPR) repeat protein
LTDSYPAVYGLYKGAALTDLTANLAMAGDHAEAVAAAIEAQQSYQHIPERQRLNLELELIDSLWSLGQRLLAAREADDAVRVTTIVVEVLQRLINAAPEQYEQSLARALVNLTAADAVAGHWADALKAVEAAIAIFQRHALTNSDDRQSLADCRQTQTFIMKQLGHSD